MLLAGSQTTAPAALALARAGGGLGGKGTGPKSHTSVPPRLSPTHDTLPAHFQPLLPPWLGLSATSPTCASEPRSCVRKGDDNPPCLCRRRGGPIVWARKRR